MGTLTGAAMEDGDAQQSDLPASFGSVISTAADQAFSDAPILSLIPRAVELNLAQTRYAWTQKKYTHDEAKAYVRDKGLPDDWLADKGYNKLELDILSRRKKDELGRQEVMARDPGGMLRGSARLATAFAVSALDPGNIASAFIPFVGEEMYSRLLLKQTTALGRAGVRASVGAVEGAGGALVLEPLVAGVHHQEMADYSMADSLLNVGFGGLFGGVLHPVAGAIGDFRASARVRQIDDIISRVEVPKTGSEMKPSEVDTGPDPFAQRSTADRIRESGDLRDELRALNNESGWDTVGGKIVRASEDPSSPDFETITGRTPWLPRAEWWPGRPGGFNESETAQIIEKAINGERLGTKQAEYLDYLVSVADERVKSKAFAPNPDDLAAAGLAASRDNSFETAMVARAMEIDENAVERFAIKHENDDAGFLKSVKEFLNEHDKNAAASGGSQVGTGASSGAAVNAPRISKSTGDAVMQSALAQALSDKPIRIEGLAKIDGDRAAAVDAIRADAEHAANPDNSPLADVEAVKAADEQIAATKADPVLQATDEMTHAESLLKDALSTMGDVESLPADLRAELDAAQQFDNEVQSMSDAASMLVQCAMRHGL